MSKDKAFLQFFWDLAEDEAGLRVAGAAGLLRFVHTHPEELQYAVGRLVKGLASPRHSARLGFASCLAGLLQAEEGVDVREVLELLDENSKCIAY
ncbi:hypothetical protein B484DRAFT_390654 [Ochromonadaceae sp. CCMP2298]|nr:hypothetical protein B484DRAFT_390654 [Ochromonadaceae sp. CCMP2298]